jgi:predicted O-methyltransferase YrrM
MIGIDITKALEIDGWMKREELEWLARKALDAQNIVEIGAFRGRSTRALTDHCSGTVYTIDTWAGDPRDLAPTKTRKHYIEYSRLGSEGAFEEFVARHKEAMDGGYLVPMRSASSAGCAALLNTVGREFDLAFIDGCHAYEAVIEDIESCRKLVRPGGIISGHDYLHQGHPGVKRAVDDAFVGTHSLHHAIWWVTA